jgi:hypothetical protein
VANVQGGNFGHLRPLVRGLGRELRASNRNTGNT